MKECCDCCLVERLVLKKKKSQSTFSHFNNKN